MKMTDEIKASIRKYLKGDKEAFEELYKLSYAYLHTCVIHVMKDENEAQDILQETYIEISKNMGQLRDPDSFLSWAAKIANRKCFALLKQRDRELLTLDPEKTSDFLENLADDEDFLPESFIQKKEKERLLQEIIDDLTDMQRLCVVAFFYRQLSQEEIAEELGIPVNTVKSHLNRAKAKIKTAVMKLDEEKGTRLYALAPLLLLLWDTEAEACTIPAMSDRIAREAEKKTVGADGESVTGRTTAGESTAGTAGESTAGSDASEGGTIGVKRAGLPKAALLSAATVAVIGGIAAVLLFAGRGKNGTEEADSSAPPESVTASEQPSENIAPSEHPSEEENLPVEETEEPEVELQELAVSITAYDNYGSAYGGVIPVKQGDLWGIADYEGNMVVPCEYDGFYSPDKLGNTALYRTAADGESEYFLFDKEGNILYQGPDEVRASGGMYITFHRELERVNAVVEYHSLDGSLAFSLECDSDMVGINTFYDGLSYVFDSLNSNIWSDGEQKGPLDGEIPPRIGAVNSTGEVSWQIDPGYYEFWEEVNASIDEHADDQQYATSAQSGGAFYSGQAPISTGNHGYTVTTDYLYVLDAQPLNVWDETGRKAASIQFPNLYLDGDGRVILGDGWMSDENTYYGFYVDGGYLWNYGPHMVFGVQDKNVLVDFSKNTVDDGVDMDQIVTAVYDSIRMSDEAYWLAGSGDQWGYIDHDGNEIEFFQDASGFINGYALIKEDGKIWLIDEEFHRLQDLGEGDSVYALGELFQIVSGDKAVLYQITGI